MANAIKKYWIFCYWVYFSFLEVIIISINAKTHFYISTHGNDSWNGLYPDHISGNDGPFLTLQTAQIAIRGSLAKWHQNIAVDENSNILKNNTLSFTVFIRSGRYFTPRLKFDARDSGLSVTSPIIWQQYPNDIGKGIVTISGGTQLKGFNISANKKIWSLKLPLDVEVFHQIWINGEHRVQARSPNEGNFFYRDGSKCGNLEKCRECGREIKNWTVACAHAAQSLQYYNGDVLPTYYAQDEVNVIVYHGYTTSTHWIANISSNPREINFTKAAHTPIGFYGTKPNVTESGGRYYIRNIREGLDAPGEWYLDTFQRELLYIPMSGELPETIDIIVPQTVEILTINYTKNVKFGPGLEFAHADWSGSCPPGYNNFWGSCDEQSDQWQDTASIHIQNAQNIVFDDISVRAVTMFGIWLQNTDHISIINSIFKNLGSGAIRIGEQPCTQPVDQYTLIRNNTITKAGLFSPAATAIVMPHVNYAKVLHNDISKVHKGVSVGWNHFSTPHKPITSTCGMYCQSDYNCTHPLPGVTMNCRNCSSKSKCVNKKYTCGMYCESDYDCTHVPSGWKINCHSCNHTTNKCVNGNINNELSCDDKDKKDPIPFCPSLNNEIAYNFVHDIGLGLNDGTTCFYTLGYSKGTIIHDNYCRDVTAYLFGGHGIYLDDGSNHVAVMNNIILRTSSTPIQAKGPNTTIHNNIFTFGGWGYPLAEGTGIGNSGFGTICGGLRTPAGAKVTNNIVLNNNPSIFSGCWDTIPGVQFRFDKNVWWSVNNSLIDLPVWGGNPPQSFSNWKAQGQDLNSIISDPLIVDPHHGNFDLSSNSPALKLGFKSINMSNIGLFKQTFN